jgi:hypothetical protein
MKRLLNISKGARRTWIHDVSLVVLGGRSISGTEHNYPIDVHELARIVLTRLRGIRGQRNIVWAGCQAICEVLQENQSSGLVQTIAQLTNNVCKK